MRFGRGVGGAVLVPEMVKLDRPGDDFVVNEGDAAAADAERLLDAELRHEVRRLETQIAYSMSQLTRQVRQIKR